MPLLHQNLDAEDNTWPSPQRICKLGAKRFSPAARPPPSMTLADYLDAIPGLGSLEDLPSGTPVLVRGDVDAKPGPNIGDGDIRLRSMVDTLQFGRQHGWKQIIFGHIGRKPEGSLAKVAKRLGEILECEVPLIADWLDETTMTILPAAAEQIAAAEPGA